MAKRVDLSLSEKVKLVSELKLHGVTQASVAKKYGVSTSQVSRKSKKRMILFEISRVGAIIAENESEKARRRM